MNSTRSALPAFISACRSALRPEQGVELESAADVRLDGDEMTADSDDGDAGHATVHVARNGLVAA